MGTKKIINEHNKLSNQLSTMIWEFTDKCIETIQEISQIEPQALDLSQNSIDILYTNGYFITECWTIDHVENDNGIIKCINIGGDVIKLSDCIIADIQDVTDTIVSNFEELTNNK